MNPSKISFSKARTIQKDGKWVKREFSVEITLEDGDSPELAKQNAVYLVNAWLLEEEKHG